MPPQDSALFPWLQAGTLVASPAGVLRLFQALVTDALAALDAAPAWQARGDWYVYAVLGALPWGGKELQRVSPPPHPRHLRAHRAHRAGAGGALRRCLAQAAACGLEVGLA